MAFLNKGDEVLLPNPGYPTYTSVTRLVGAKPVFYQLKDSMDYQPDLEALEKRITPKTKLMWVSYPHMPTGAKPQPETFKKLKTFAKTHNILVINDNPYSLTLNEKLESILDDYNSNENLLELNSLSKSFNLAGWRVGMLCGHENLVNTVLKVKSNVDSGMFYGIQKGAIAAMNASKAFIANQDSIYHKRRERIWKLCEQLDLEFDRNSAGLFVWAKIKNAKTSVQFSDDLLYNYRLFVTPGIVFGSAGENYVRFSLCLNEAQIKIAIERTKAFKP
jgi:aspartate/methionine/tyrosine aminotransferase